MRGMDCDAAKKVEIEGYAEQGLERTAGGRVVGGDPARRTAQGNTLRPNLLCDRLLQGKAGRSVHQQPKGYLEEKRAIAAYAKIKSGDPPTGLIVPRLTQSAYQLFLSVAQLTRRAYLSGQLQKLIDPPSVHLSRITICLRQIAIWLRKYANRTGGKAKVAD